MKILQINVFLKKRLGSTYVLLSTFEQKTTLFDDLKAKKCGETARFWVAWGRI
jgi:hypothetical protein